MVNYGDLAKKKTARTTCSPVSRSLSSVLTISTIYTLFVIPFVVARSEGDAYARFPKSDLRGNLRMSVICPHSVRVYTYRYVTHKLLGWLRSLLRPTVLRARVGEQRAVAGAPVWSRRRSLWSLRPARSIVTAHLSRVVPPISRWTQRTKQCCTHMYFYRRQRTWWVYACI